MKKFKKLFLLISITCLLMSIFVYAYVGFINVNGGYKLGATSQGIYLSDLNSCSIASNNGDKTFFIPTRSVVEIDAFHAHTPGDIVITSDLQPECASTKYDCVSGTDPGFHSPEYECGIDAADLCYDWDCNTECGSTTCTFVIPGGCFVEGTKITLADGTMIPVELVSTGDIVLGGAGSLNTVQKLFKIFYQRRLFSLNGSNYFVSDSHPFMTTEGWKSFDPKATLLENPDMIISTLEVGDVLVTDHGLVKLLSISSEVSPQYVYNFKTNGNHTYYADGFLVHNPNIKAQ